MSYPDLPRSIEEGSEFFRSFHLLTLELSTVGTLKDLYREAVRRGRELLGIDRMAILLYDPDSLEMWGTFGTDEEGAVVDESDYHAPVDPANRYVIETLEAKNQVVVWENMALTNRGGQVGKGWNGMGALWDGTRPFGWLAVDNLLTGQPLRSLQRDLLGLYCSILGGLILRKRHEEELVRKIAETTAELRLRMADLEKMASLGSLVAGVYHDVNTPMGNALLANSYISMEVGQIRQALDSKTLTQGMMVEFFGKLSSSTQVIGQNLERAMRLIENFKRLAVSQSAGDSVRTVSLRETVEAVTVSFSPKLRGAGITVSLDIDPELTMETVSGILEQILSNLISNSLIHGFEGWSCGNPRVVVNGGLVPDRRAVYLDYRDNGRGIAPEVRDTLYQPYVTTKRDQGGTGLGMSIVHSLVTGRLGGTIEIYDPEGGGAGFRIVLPPEPPDA